MRVVKVGTAFLTTEMDGETVMMDVDSGQYFGLKGVGNRIWTLIGTPKGISEIVDTLCEEYDVERATAEADAQSFCKSLVDAGLAEWK